MEGQTYEIQLANGGVALVDYEDFVRLDRYNWRWFKTGSKTYVGRYGLNEQKVSRIYYMHREIIQPTRGMCVDHINGDPFDNRRENLRLCTYAENARNCKVYKNNTTGFKGVSRRGRGYRVDIQYNRVRMHAGGFTTAEDAAAFYDEVTTKLFGEFARPNGIQSEPTPEGMLF